MKKTKENNTEQLKNPELERENEEKLIEKFENGETLVKRGVTPLPSSTYVKF